MKGGSSMLSHIPPCDVTCAKDSLEEFMETEVFGLVRVLSNIASL